MDLWRVKLGHFVVKGPIAIHNGEHGAESHYLTPVMSIIQVLKGHPIWRSRALFSSNQSGDENRSHRVILRYCEFNMTDEKLLSVNIGSDVLNIIVKHSEIQLPNDDSRWATMQRLCYESYQTILDTSSERCNTVEQNDGEQIKAVIASSTFGGVRLQCHWNECSGGVESIVGAWGRLWDFLGALPSCEIAPLYERYAVDSFGDTIDASASEVKLFPRLIVGR